eukprot:TRINITY_DN5220_c0_g1_i1.p1 TRINITY_DN5220_c0_g1~~TRINITY_DN5220_c0_g1_i1.p1  ORF type:complete len:1634 (+),score=264.52 TRINITY_DN5220_c0_g1_i1:129-5030(+)
MTTAADAVWHRLQEPVRTPSHATPDKLAKVMYEGAHVAGRCAVLVPIQHTERDVALLAERLQYCGYASQDIQHVQPQPGMEVTAQDVLISVQERRATLGANGVLFVVICGRVVCSGQGLAVSLGSNSGGLLQLNDLQEFASPASEHSVILVDSSCAPRVASVGLREASEQDIGKVSLRAGVGCIFSQHCHTPSLCVYTAACAHELLQRKLPICPNSLNAVFERHRDVWFAGRCPLLRTGRSSRGHVGKVPIADWSITSQRSQVGPVCCTMHVSIPCPGTHADALGVLHRSVPNKVRCRLVPEGSSCRFAVRCAHSAPDIQRGLGELCAVYSIPHPVMTKCVDGLLCGTCDQAQWPSLRSALAQAPGHLVVTEQAGATVLQCFTVDVAVSYLEYTVLDAVQRSCVSDPATGMRIDEISLPTAGPDQRTSPNPPPTLSAVGQLSPPRRLAPPAALGVKLPSGAPPFARSPQKVHPPPSDVYPSVAPSITSELSGLHRDLSSATVGDARSIAEEALRKATEAVSRADALAQQVGDLQSRTAAAASTATAAAASAAARANRPTDAVTHSELQHLEDQVHQLRMLHVQIRDAQSGSPPAAAPTSALAAEVRQLSASMANIAARVNGLEGARGAEGGADAQQAGSDAAQLERDAAGTRQEVSKLSSDVQGLNAAVGEMQSMLSDMQRHQQPHRPSNRSPMVHSEDAESAAARSVSAVDQTLLRRLTHLEEEFAKRDELKDTAAIAADQDLMRRLAHLEEELSRSQQRDTGAGSAVDQDLLRRLAHLENDVAKNDRQRDSSAVQIATLNSMVEKLTVSVASGQTRDVYSDRPDRVLSSVQTMIAADRERAQHSWSTKLEQLRDEVGSVGEGAAAQIAELRGSVEATARAAEKFQMLEERLVSAEREMRQRDAALREQQHTLDKATSERMTTAERYADVAKRAAELAPAAAREAMNDDLVYVKEDVVRCRDGVTTSEHALREFARKLADALALVQGFQDRVQLVEGGLNDQSRGLKNCEVGVDALIGTVNSIVPRLDAADAEMVRTARQLDEKIEREIRDALSASSFQMNESLNKVSAEIRSLHDRMLNVMATAEGRATDAEKKAAAAEAAAVRVGDQVTSTRDRLREDHEQTKRDLRGVLQQHTEALDHSLETMRRELGDVRGKTDACRTQQTAFEQALNSVRDAFETYVRDGTEQIVVAQSKQLAEVQDSCHRQLAELDSKMNAADAARDASDSEMQRVLMNIQSKMHAPAPAPKQEQSELDRQKLEKVLEEVIPAEDCLKRLEDAVDELTQKSTANAAAVTTLAGRHDELREVVSALARSAQSERDASVQRQRSVDERVVAAIGSAREDLHHEIQAALSASTQGLQQLDQIVCQQRLESEAQAQRLREEVDAVGQAASRTAAAVSEQPHRDAEWLNQLSNLHEHYDRLRSEILEDSRQLRMNIDHTQRQVQELAEATADAQNAQRHQLGLAEAAADSQKVQFSRDASRMAAIEDRIAEHEKQLQTRAEESAALGSKLQNTREGLAEVVQEKDSAQPAAQMADMIAAGVDSRIGDLERQLASTSDDFAQHMDVLAAGQEDLNDQISRMQRELGSTSDLAYELSGWKNTTDADLKNQFETIRRCRSDVTSLQIKVSELST